MKSLLLSMLILVLPAAALAAGQPSYFFGRCIQLDTGFPYYQNRSNESIVEEIIAHGYTTVALCSGSSTVAKAFAARGIPARYMASSNVLYTVNAYQLPKNWESWKMVLRKDGQNSGVLVYLCENDPEFREWKKNEIVNALSGGGFSAIDIVEPYMPAFEGVKSDWYGCMCDDCKAAFLKMYPEETAIPEFNDEKSPNFWKTNTALYKKWVDFRVDTVADFLDYLVNGPGGIREKCPGVKVCTWSIAADIPNPVESMREWEASDGVAICKKVHPDAHCIQTDWPDWVRPDLRPDYVLKYKPFVDAIRAAGIDIPIAVQTDSGSGITMRRSGQWLRTFERAAKEAGFAQTMAYEYHIGLDLYTEAPKLVKACLDPAKSKVTLIFDQRLDPEVATDKASYKLASGKVLSASLDGNIVKLTVKNVKQGDTITVLKASNDPSVRWSNDKLLANVSPEMSCVIE